MFAFCRSPIGQAALTLGCVCTLAATSVQAQAPDAGVPDAAQVDAAQIDAAQVEEAPADVPPPAEVVAPVETPVEAPVEPVGPALEPGADAETGIRGRIVDAKSGLGIEMAPVLIVDRERTRTAITITNGAYELNVPPGVYTVRSFYDLYHGARLSNVRVSRGRFIEVNLLLDPINEVEEIAVEEIEVPYRADTTTAAAQDELRRASSGIGEGMGSQQMSQSGASDAGSAAKRVVGVTVEGTSLVIRGLGGRYSRVYMNGVPVPSTDPDSPSVDLDLFPTNIIDSMTVSKTFLPDMPADFAGGVLEIATVTFPREFTLELGVSGEYSSKSTLRHRLDYNGGSLDVLGFDDGTRSLPSAVPPGRFRGSNFPDQGKAVADSFENTWSYRRRLGAPGLGLDLTVGDAIDLPGGSRFGYLVTTTYDHKDVRTTGYSRKIATQDTNGDGLPDTTGEFPHVEVGSEEVQVAGIGTASLDIGSDHSFTLLSMFNRSASDETSLRQGSDMSVDVGQVTEKWQLQYTARQLWFNQLMGDHRNLGGTRMRARWNGYYAPSLRDEPDRRNITYAPTGEDPRPRWQNQRAERMFSQLEGVDGGGGASLRFPLWSEAWGTVGGSVRYTQRDFSARRFQMATIVSSITNDDLLRPPEELFGPMGTGTWTRLATEYTRNNDSYYSTQSVYTAYAMLETPVVGPLSLTGGARAEVYDQGLSVQSPLLQEEDADPPITADRTDVNVLPGVAAKFELSETMLVRAAYGLTVGRPQARELAPFQYFDFLRDRIIVGNPDLRTTRIHNVDLRWEWFFAEAQILAASLFYKKFLDPIEQYLGPQGTSAIYANTPSAQAFGAEVEFRANLKPINAVLRNFDFGANVTLVHSRVEVPPEQSMAVAPGPRQLYGQAPYVINVSLRFADPATKTSLGLVYNLVGPRLLEVGFREGMGILPNVEVLPIHSLDFVASWSMSDHLKLKAKWKNMLFQTRRLDQGGVIVLEREPGTFVSVGLEYAH